MRPRFGDASAAFARRVAGSGGATVSCPVGSPHKSGPQCRPEDPAPDRPSDGYPPPGPARRPRSVGADPEQGRAVPGTHPTGGCRRQAARGGTEARQFVNETSGTGHSLKLEMRTDEAAARMTIRQQVKMAIVGNPERRETRRAVLALALPLVGSDLLQRGVNVVRRLAGRAAGGRGAGRRGPVASSF